LIRTGNAKYRLTAHTMVIPLYCGRCKPIGRWGTCHLGVRSPSAARVDQNIRCGRQRYKFAYTAVARCRRRKSGERRRGRRKFADGTVSAREYLGRTWPRENALGRV
jgi:hypothetical protein